VANVPRAKDALRSSSSEKTPEPALPSNKEPSIYIILGHRKEAMLQLQIAIPPWRDNPPGISNQIPSRGSILSEGASKTGKYSVTILKIVKFLQSDFLTWLEQSGLFFNHKLQKW
jgi:hypothetical protein